MEPVRGVWLAVVVLREVEAVWRGSSKVLRSAGEKGKG